MLSNCGAGGDSWASLEPPRRSNQSILKEISPEYSLEGLMLKLKLQSLGHLMTHLKRPWCWERLKAGGEGDDRGWDGWMASSTQWTWVWASSGRQWRTGKPGVLWSMGSQRAGHYWVAEQPPQSFLIEIIQIGSICPLCSQKYSNVHHPCYRWVVFCALCCKYFKTLLCAIHKAEKQRTAYSCTFTPKNLAQKWTWYKPSAMESTWSEYQISTLRITRKENKKPSQFGQKEK